MVITDKVRYRMVITDKLRYRMVITDKVRYRMVITDKVRYRMVITKRGLIELCAEWQGERWDCRVASGMTITELVGFQRAEYRMAIIELYLLLKLYLR